MPKGFLLSCLIAAGVVANARGAVDCGDPPMPLPTIPDGSTAGRESMLAAVEAVKIYSDNVDAWLTCKDERAVTVFQWMNDEQRERWTEDLDHIHQQRVEVQRQMNEAIRLFNQSTANAGSG